MLSLTVKKFNIEEHIDLIFGCRAKAHINAGIRRKEEDKSRPGLFVGYDESSRSFNFLPGGTGVISLICDENLVPPTSIPEDKSWDFIEAVTISEEILKGTT